MMMFGKAKLGQPVFRWLLLLSFWGVWLALPFIMFDDSDERHRAMFVQMLPVSFSNVVLFFIIGEWLGPCLLSQQRLKAYLFSVLGLSVLFLIVQGAAKNWMLAPDNKGIPYHMFRGMVHVFFATAMGIGYALIRHTFGEEKARQEQQQERLKSELSFLRSQISPHFIFNILNSIVYLIRSKSDQAEQVTLQLSSLMRYMLYESGDAQIPLEKELGYLKDYVELQKIRFEEDVDIRLQIEGEPAAQVIEPMLMIPFVENAFKHGVGLIQSPVIDILVKMTEKELLFVAQNKLTPDAKEDKDSNSGIGLQNVRRRLELLYPEEHNLHIEQKDGWFKASLRIHFPLHKL